MEGSGASNLAANAQLVIREVFELRKINGLESGCCGWYKGPVQVEKHVAVCINGRRNFAQLRLALFPLTFARDMATHKITGSWFPLFIINSYIKSHHIVIKSQT